MGRSRSVESSRRAAALAVLWLSVAFSSGAHAAPAPQEPPGPTESPAGDPVAALLAQHDALSAEFARSPFEQPLHVDSSEGPRQSEGEVFGVVEHPIAAVVEAFANPAHWCDTLILHLNVKYCRAGEGESGNRLSVAIGRKRDRELSGTSRVEFAYRVVASQPDYLDVVLEAARGPLGTGNYLVELEAVRLDDARSFVHMRYSYRYGTRARFAMRLYLATSGSGKVGFTSVGEAGADGPKLIRGVRGAIERNVMRYFLAIDAYLGVRSLPEPERFEASLDRWFSATERYPRQLHELDRDEYLALKRREYLRQQ